MRKGWGQRGGQSHHRVPPASAAALNRAVPLQQLQPLQRVQPLRWVRPFAPQPAPSSVSHPALRILICPSALHLSLRTAFIRPHPSPDHQKPQRSQGTSSCGAGDGVGGWQRGPRLLPFGSPTSLPAPLPARPVGAAERGAIGDTQGRERLRLFSSIRIHPPQREPGWGGGDEETHSVLQRRCCHPSLSVRFIIIYSFFWSVILASRLASWRSRVINIGILVSGESPPADTSAPGPPATPSPTPPHHGAVLAAANMFGRVPLAAAPGRCRESAPNHVLWAGSR